MYIQRRGNPSGHKCCHHSSSNSVNFLHNISNISSHPTSQRYLSQPKTVWTVPLEASLDKALDSSLTKTDPIYEDISEVKRKISDTSKTKDNTVDNCKEVVTSSQGSKMKQSPSSSSSVLYGVITAKEVARFVPCNNVDIGR